MPTTRKPGRPRKDEIQERLAIYAQHDEQILKEHDTWLEMDISTPTLPQQIMKIDKVDYESIKSDLAGRFIARISAAFNNQPLAYAHPRNKDGKFSATPSYVHNLICKHRGFLWHRNGDQLDNRRDNLETNIPMQLSTVGKFSDDEVFTNIDIEQLMESLTGKSETAPSAFPPKPIYKPQPYDPNAKHEMIDLLTGNPETTTGNNEIT